MLSSNEGAKWQSMKWAAENSHITVTSDYIEAKISAESRRVSMFIKTMRTSTLTSDKFIYKFLKGTEIPTSLCVMSRRKIHLGHARSHDPGWQFSCPQLPQQHVKAKVMYVYYWRRGRQESKSLWGRCLVIIDTTPYISCHGFTKLHFKSN